MADQKTNNQTASGLRKVHFAASLLIGTLLGYKVSLAYSLFTPLYLAAFSALGALAVWSFTLIFVSIIEANRDLNSDLPKLERMQAKLSGLQESGKVPKMPQDRGL